MNFMTWYDALIKPVWTPSPGTMRLIWRILYPCDTMGVIKILQVSNDLLFGDSMAAKSSDNLSDLSTLCDLLSDKTRLQIVMILAKGESNVTNLCEILGLPQPSVSHHLGLLRMNRLIVNKRKGKTVIYSLATNAKAAGGKLKVALPPYSVTVEGF